MINDQNTPDNSYVPDDSATAALSGQVPAAPSTAGIPAVSGPAPTMVQGVAPAPAAPGMKWQAILQGALAGLAGSGNAKNFTQGLVAGVGGDMKYNQQQKENDVQQQQLQNQTAETQSNIKFRDLQSAEAAINLSHIDQVFQQHTQEAQDNAQDHADQHAKFLTDNYGFQLTPMPNTASAVVNHLEQGTANDPSGTVQVPPPGAVIMGPHTIYAPKEGPNTFDQEYAFMTDAAKVTGSPLPTRAQFDASNPQQKTQAYSRLNNLFMGRDPNTGEPLSGDKLPGTIATLQTTLKNYEDDKANNPNPQVAKQMQSTISTLQAQLKGFNDNQTAQKGAEAKATGELAVRQSEAFKNNQEGLKAAQDAKTGKDATTMMVGALPDGTQIAGTPDELKAKGLTSFTKLGAAESAKVNTARQLVSPSGLLSNVEKDIAAFKPEELSTLGARWNEFATGKVGDGDPRYTALRTDTKLLSTALMQAHVGSRGSEGMMEHFGNLADAGKMNAQTLKSAIATERRYVTEKAMLPNSAKVTPTSTSNGSFNPNSLPDAK